MKKNTQSLVSLVLLINFFILQINSFAQTPYAPEKLTVEDYKQGEMSLWQHTNPLIIGGNVKPHWIDENQFWYQNSIEDGKEFILVNIEKRHKMRAFDHEKLAKALSRVVGKDYDPFDLPFSSFEFADNKKAIVFNIRSTQYTFDSNASQCTPSEAPEKADRKSSLSPDGKKAAFIREHNLWVKDLESGKETQLTTDGVKDFGYATNNAGWIKKDKPVLLWSPDSRKIATFQHDGRGVGEMYLATTNVGHPELEAWKYPLPGDSLIFRIHRVVIHLDGPKVVRLQMEPDPHRSSFTDHIATRRGDFGDVEWSEDGSQLAFLSNSRDHKEAVLRVANPKTGEVRTVLDENVKTFFESGYKMSNWHVLPESNDVIWYSQRSNWGHLYLYDLETGKLKNEITKGEWNVIQVLKIDKENGVIYFYGVGKEEGDPYFQYLYRVNLDGTGLKLLTPEKANHVVSLSESGKYFVDNYSTPRIPPVSVLRDQRGIKMLDLEKS